MALDRDHLAGDPAHHRGGVARAGADLEHPSPGRDLGRLDHQRDDIGLRDGLAGLDRQRPVLIGEGAHLIGHEHLARNRRASPSSSRASLIPRPAICRWTIRSRWAAKSVTLPSCRFHNRRGPGAFRQSQPPQGPPSLLIREVAGEFGW